MTEESADLFIRHINPQRIKLTHVGKVYYSSGRIEYNPNCPNNVKMMVMAFLASLDHGG